MGKTKGWGALALCALITAMSLPATGVRADSCDDSVR